MLVEVAQPGRQAEDVHLAAGVVDVILARHIPAGEGAGWTMRRHRRRRGHDRRAAGRSGWPRRIRPAPSARRRRWNGQSSAFAQHGAHDAGLGAGVEGEIDETGARHLGMVTSTETGSSASNWLAISRGFFFSALASCMARLVDQSPCVGSRGRSSWMGVSAGGRGNAGQPVATGRSAGI